MRTILQIFIIAILLFGCQDDINYVGKYSPPVDNDTRPITLEIPKLSSVWGSKQGTISLAGLHRTEQSFTPYNQM